MPSTVCDNRADPAPHENPSVPDFLPFHGTRYHGAADLSAVVAPPYDVVDEEERARLEALDPHNSVRLILPRPRPPLDAYEAAAALLDEWRGDGTLVVDDVPALYAYEMRFRDATGRDRATVGVLGALTLPDADGDVLGHERTLPKARSDRLALLRATRANLDPIWGLSLAPGLTGLLAGDEPAMTATDPEGTVHTLRPITEPEAVAAVRAGVASAPVVLADGHHRFETARTYRDEHPEDAGAAAMLALIVELDDAMLDVRAIHRLVHGVPPDLRARVGPDVVVEAVGPNTDSGVGMLLERMERDDGLGLVDRDGLALLTLTAGARAAVKASAPAELHGVDAARFDTVVRPALGDATLAYRDDARTVAAMVDKGLADAAALLKPVTVAQIRAAAFARLRMPEKTTFFSPKPRTGMVLRGLDDG